MKKIVTIIITLILILTMALTLCAWGGEQEAQETVGKRIGVLTMLNLSEEDMESYVYALYLANQMLVNEGYITDEFENQTIDGIEIVFYDSLDAMLMGLNAGDIDAMQVYNKTGEYLCATNDNLKLGIVHNFEKEPNAFLETLLDGHKSGDFSFLMMEGNETLRDEFDTAISEMKEDGTLDRLVSEQIDAVINGEDVESIEMPEIDGAETITVAVTGALPPMDYVAADGKPAGYNTAVLAEISQRIGKNIKLVVVDSIGRMTALSSGSVDAVFWSRTNERFYYLTKLDDEERQKDYEEKKKEYEEKNAGMNEEELELLEQIKELIDIEKFCEADRPEGTICTIPYFSDIIVPVVKK